jgi:hypothetical protein
VEEAEENNYGSDSEDDEDNNDLGAEDGEEPWDMDDLHAEGYDDL